MYSFQRMFLFIIKTVSYKNFVMCLNLSGILVEGGREITLEIVWNIIISTSLHTCFLCIIYWSFGSFVELAFEEEKRVYNGEKKFQQIVKENLISLRCNYHSNSRIIFSSIQLTFVYFKKVNRTQLTIVSMKVNQTQVKAHRKWVKLVNFNSVSSLMPNIVDNVW